MKYLRRSFGILGWQFPKGVVFVFSLLKPIFNGGNFSRNQYFDKKFSEPKLFTV